MIFYTFLNSMTVLLIVLLGVYLIYILFQISWLLRVTRAMRRHAPHVFYIPFSVFTTRPFHKVALPQFLCNKLITGRRRQMKRRYRFTDSTKERMMKMMSSFADALSDGEEDFNVLRDEFERNLRKHRKASNNNNINKNNKKKKEEEEKRKRKKNSSNVDVTKFGEKEMYNNNEGRMLRESRETSKAALLATELEEMQVKLKREQPSNIYSSSIDLAKTRENGFVETDSRNTSVNNNSIYSDTNCSNSSSNGKNITYEKYKVKRANKHYCTNGSNNNNNGDGISDSGCINRRNGRINTILPNDSNSQYQFKNEEYYTTLNGNSFGNSVNINSKHNLFMPSNGYNDNNKKKGKNKHSHTHHSSKKYAGNQMPMREERKEHNRIKLYYYKQFGIHSHSAEAKEIARYCLTEEEEDVLWGAVLDVHTIVSRLRDNAARVAMLDRQETVHEWSHVEMSTIPTTFSHFHTENVNTNDTCNINSCNGCNNSSNNNTISDAEGVIAALKEQEEESDKVGVFGLLLPAQLTPSSKPTIQLSRKLERRPLKLKFMQTHMKRHRSISPDNAVSSQSCNFEDNIRSKSFNGCGNRATTHFMNANCAETLNAGNGYRNNRRSVNDENEDENEDEFNEVERRSVLSEYSTESHDTMNSSGNSHERHGRRLERHLEYPSSGLPRRDSVNHNNIPQYSDTSEATSEVGSSEDDANTLPSHRFHNPHQELHRKSTHTTPSLLIPQLPQSSLLILSTNLHFQPIQCNTSSMLLCKNNNNTSYIDAKGTNEVGCNNNKWNRTVCERDEQGKYVTAKDNATLTIGTADSLHKLDEPQYSKRAMYVDPQSDNMFATAPFKRDDNRVSNNYNNNSTNITKTSYYTTLPSFTQLTFLVGGNNTVIKQILTTNASIAFSEHPITSQAVRYVCFFDRSDEQRSRARLQNVYRKYQKFKLLESRLNAAWQRNNIVSTNTNKNSGTNTAVSSNNPSKTNRRSDSNPNSERSRAVESNKTTPTISNKLTFDSYPFTLPLHPESDLINNNYNNNNNNNNNSNDNNNNYHYHRNTYTRGNYNTNTVTFAEGHGSNVLEVSSKTLSSYSSRYNFASSPFTISSIVRANSACENTSNNDVNTVINSQREQHQREKEEQQEEEEEEEYCHHCDHHHLQQQHSSRNQRSKEKELVEEQETLTKQINNTNTITNDFTCAAFVDIHEQTYCIHSRLGNLCSSKLKLEKRSSKNSKHSSSANFAKETSSNNYNSNKNNNNNNNNNNNININAITNIHDKVDDIAVAELSMDALRNCIEPYVKRSKFFRSRFAFVNREGRMSTNNNNVSHVGNSNGNAIMHDSEESNTASDDFNSSSSELSCNENHSNCYDSQNNQRSQSHKKNHKKFDEIDLPLAVATHCCVTSPDTPATTSLPVCHNNMETKSCKDNELWTRFMWLLKLNEMPSSKERLKKITLETRNVKPLTVERSIHFMLLYGASGESVVKAMQEAYLKKKSRETLRELAQNHFKDGFDLSLSDHNSSIITTQCTQEHQGYDVNDNMLSTDAANKSESITELNDPHSVLVTAPAEHPQTTSMAESENAVMLSISSGVMNAFSDKTTYCKNNNYNNDKATSSSSPSSFAPVTVSANGTKAPVTSSSLMKDATLTETEHIPFTPTTETNVPHCVSEIEHTALPQSEGMHLYNDNNKNSTNNVINSNENNDIALIDDDMYNAIDANHHTIENDLPDNEEEFHGESFPWGEDECTSRVPDVLSPLTEDMKMFPDGVEVPLELNYIRLHNTLYKVTEISDKTFLQYRHMRASITTNNNNNNNNNSTNTINNFINCNRSSLQNTINVYPSASIFESTSGKCDYPSEGNPFSQSENDCCNNMLHSEHDANIDMNSMFNNSSISINSNDNSSNDNNNNNNNTNYYENGNEAVHRRDRVSWLSVTRSMHNSNKRKHGRSARYLSRIKRWESMSKRDFGNVSYSFTPTLAPTPLLPKTLESTTSTLTKQNTSTPFLSSWNKTLNSALMTTNLFDESNNNDPNLNIDITMKNSDNKSVFDVSDTNNDNNSNNNNMTSVEAKQVNSSLNAPEGMMPFSLNQARSTSECANKQSHHQPHQKQEEWTREAVRMCWHCLCTPATVIFLPCAHYACCEYCADELIDCCVCGTAIKSTIKLEQNVTSIM